jgi:hypothetical protein
VGNPALPLKGDNQFVNFITTLDKKKLADVKIGTMYS